MRDFPENYDPKQPLTPHIVGVEDQLVRGTRPYLLALLGAVGFVLLIACANVANLLLVRGESRHREMAVRSALGASRFRLLSQSLTESAVLAVVGGGLGLLLAWAGDRLLLRLAPSSIPRLDEIGIDWRVVAFCGAAAIVTGLLIGIVPGWRASHGQSADALKAGGRSLAAHGSRGLRRVLVVTEVMLAVVTLAGAGMLVRSLWNLQDNDLGFDPRGVLTAKVALWQRSYDDQRTATFFDQALERIRAVPGVRAAGAVGWLPIVDAGGLWSFEPEGKAFPPGLRPISGAAARYAGRDCRDGPFTRRRTRFHQRRPRWRTASGHRQRAVRPEYLAGRKRFGKTIQGGRASTADDDRWCRARHTRSRLRRHA